MAKSKTEINFKEHLKSLLPAGGDASELEAAAQALAGLSPENSDLLVSVQESPYRLTTLEQFREFPANTEYFVLEPNISKVEDVGWRYLAQHLDVLLPPELLDAIDPVPFGHHAMREEQGCFTSRGYVKEIDPGLHALQAEVGGDIAASYPFDDPVGLVLNDEGKLIGLDLNRSLRDDHGEIYDIVAGTFLVVGLGPESFASLPPDMIQKYTEQFKRPELFASINGQIVSVPVEPENPLRTAEMTMEDGYGMIDGIINNGRRGEELEKTQAEACRTTPEKKPSIRERLEDAKRECGSRKAPDKPAPQKKPPELGDL